MISATLIMIAMMMMIKGNDDEDDVCQTGRERWNQIKRLSNLSSAVRAMCVRLNFLPAITTPYRRWTSDYRWFLVVQLRNIKKCNRIYLQIFGTLAPFVFAFEFGKNVNYIYNSAHSKCGYHNNNTRRRRLRKNSSILRNPFQHFWKTRLRKMAELWENNKNTYKKC